MTPVALSHTTMHRRTQQQRGHRGQTRRASGGARRASRLYPMPRGAEVRWSMWERTAVAPHQPSPLRRPATRRPPATADAADPDPQEAAKSREPLRSSTSFTVSHSLRHRSDLSESQSQSTAELDEVQHCESKGGTSTAATEKKLVAPRLPGLESSTPGSQVHCRRIGIEGWDGSDEGRGTYESEQGLANLFSSFGQVLHVAIRHRIMDPSAEQERNRGPRANTSWALVTMADADSAERAIETGVKAGSTQLQLTRFSKKQATASTGHMRVIQTVQACAFLALQAKKAQANICTEQAQQLFEESISTVDPLLPDERLHSLAQALALVQRAMELNPSLFAARQLRGRVLYRQNMVQAEVKRGKQDALLRKLFQQKYKEKWKQAMFMDLCDIYLHVYLHDFPYSICLVVMVQITNVWTGRQNHQFERRSERGLYAVGHRWLRYG